MATTNDLVLIHVHDKPGFYARIEEITPDVKPGWWQVRLLVLTFPLQVFTWILDDYQVEGAPFTMGGTPLRLEKLDFPYPEESDQKDQEEPQAHSEDSPQPCGKVISLAERRKK